MLMSMLMGVLERTIADEKWKVISLPFFLDYNGGDAMMMTPLEINRADFLIRGKISVQTLQFSDINLIKSLLSRKCLILSKCK